MYRTLKDKYAQDKDFPARTYELMMRDRVITGKLYDCLTNAFHCEIGENQEYVPLRERRPCVRSALCKVIVDDSVSLLFSEAHFPKIDHKDEATKEMLTQVIKEAMLNLVMIEAATKGSVGSIVIRFRVLDNRVFFDLIETPYLTPFWKKNAPDTLEKIVEKYKVEGKVLIAMGYAGIDEKEKYWFQRDFTEKQEIFYLPWAVNDKDAGPKVDTTKTTTHNLGFVPLVWIKNLPGGDKIDGACTFPDEVIDTNIEIDYQLSQGGRGLKYSSDPTLLIKEPATGGTGDVIKGGGNAITVGADGDAKMLEINGTAVSAVIEYTKFLREVAMESAHGNRASAEKLSTAQSGRAMELMNQALIWLADRLRITYGEGALLSLLNMVVAASNAMELKFKDGTEVGKLNKKDKVTLRWPKWYSPTADDRQKESTTLGGLVDHCILSEETATKTIAADYDIEDLQAERTNIDADRKKREEEAQATVKINA